MNEVLDTSSYDKELKKEVEIELDKKLLEEKLLELTQQGAKIIEKGYDKFKGEFALAQMPDGSIIEVRAKYHNVRVIQKDAPKEFPKLMDEAQLTRFMVTHPFNTIGYGIELRTEIENFKRLDISQKKDKIKELYHTIRSYIEEQARLNPQQAQKFAQQMQLLVRLISSVEADPIALGCLIKFAVDIDRYSGIRNEQQNINIEQKAPDNKKEIAEIEDKIDKLAALEKVMLKNKNKFSQKKLDEFLSRIKDAAVELNERRHQLIGDGR